MILYVGNLRKLEDHVELTHQIVKVESLTPRGADILVSFEKDDFDPTKAEYVPITELKLRSSVSALPHFSDK